MPRVKRNGFVDGYNAPFAERLRELIDTSKIPQSALAEYIGVTRQAVSSYSLGTSLPDIEKFEKIADYFEVSTEYLLGRTDIKKADASKQAAAKYLELSEGAVDAICALRSIQLEQNPESAYKFTAKPSEPLPEIFSSWLEKVNLPQLMSNVWRMVNSTVVAQDSGWNSDGYKLNQKQKDAIWDLKTHGYLTLSMSQQISFFSQLAVGMFNQSMDSMVDEAIAYVNEHNQARKEGDDGGAR